MTQKPNSPRIAPASREPACREARSDVSPRACPVCGGALVEIKHKLVCSRCHTICETCCEGGRG